jgi:hypothetical protein
MTFDARLGDVSQQYKYRNETNDHRTEPSRAWMHLAVYFKAKIR